MAAIGVSATGVTALARQTAPAPCESPVRARAVQPSGDVLTLEQAIDLGLRQNLSVLEADATSAQARAERLKTLAAFRPNVSARAAEASERLSLREIGLKLPGAPPTSGPFQFQDARVTVSQTVFSRELIDRYHADDHRSHAAELSADDVRDAVALAVGAAYLRIAAATAALQSANAELATAQELDRQTADRVKSEVAPEIDSLRAQVARQTAEQRVVDARSDVDKSVLDLLRAIGAPVDRPITTEPAPLDRADVTFTQDDALARALQCRSDLASVKASLDAATDDVRSKRAQALPAAGVSADYGAGGAAPNLNQVYTVTAGVSVPIFTGGRIRAEVAKADADRARRQAEYDDAVERVKYDVRVAWIDLGAARSRADVAVRNRDLAGRALAEAQDRYGNGVTNYLEVVTAQQQVAEADDRLIAARYDVDVTRLALARAMGGTAFSAGRE
jgi:outer membrane protein TolC